MWDSLKARLIVALGPEFLVVIEPQAVRWALLIGLARALLGAPFPAHAMAQLAPAEIFRR